MTSNGGGAGENGAASPGSLAYFDELQKANDADAAERVCEELTTACGPGQPGEKDAEFLWRLANQCLLLSDSRPDADKAWREKVLRDGQQAAERAVEADENNGSAHKFLAVTSGLCDPFCKGQSDRIANGHKIKKHADIAAKLLPEDATVRVVLCEFCMNVAELPWVVRMAAKVLFGEPPKATFEEALQYGLEAAAIMEKRPKPDGAPAETPGGLTVAAAENVAKCYAKLGKETERREWLAKLLKVFPRSEAEKVRQAQIQRDWEGVLGG